MGTAKDATLTHGRIIFGTNAERRGPMVSRALSIQTGRAAIARHLEILAPLNESEREALTSLKELVDFAAGQEITKPGAPLDDPMFVLAGWICRCSTLSDGRRQILDFYLPGDLVGDGSRTGKRAHAFCVALTPATCVRAGELIALTRSQPDRFPGLANVWG